MALQITSSFRNDYEYIPLSERAEKKPFMVKLRRLDLELLAFTKDSTFNVNQDQSYTLKINSQNLIALKNGLIGWQNISDDTGPVKFTMDGNVVNSTCLEYLPVELRTEIANVILAISNNPSNAELILTGETVTVDGE